MKDIKGRIACLRRLAMGSLSLGDDRLNWELAALQLRMVLESIAFASLSAHRDAYSQVHAKFAQHWKAALLLKELSAIHPEFYPQPVRFDHVKEGGIKHFERVDGGYLTQEEFIELYDICSRLIHMHNPFSDLKQIDVRLSLEGWVSRIQALLDTHFIQMHELEHLWLVQVHMSDNADVHVFVAEPTLSGRGHE